MTKNSFILKFLEPEPPIKLTSSVLFFTSIHRFVWWRWYFPRTHMKQDAKAWVTFATETVKESTPSTSIWYKFYKKCKWKRALISQIFKLIPWRTFKQELTVTIRRQHESVVEGSKVRGRILSWRHDVVKKRPMREVWRWTEKIFRVCS